MTTVLEHVAAYVFTSLERLPAGDEAGYNQLLQKLCCLMIFDLDWQPPSAYGHATPAGHSSGASI